MAFVKLLPLRTVSAARSAAPIEFGVGYRMGGVGKDGKRLGVKLRLRPKLLGEAAAFLVVGTWLDVSFDSDLRMLLIEGGAHFKLSRPGGVIADDTPMLLSFPLPAGVKTEKFILPVAEFTATPSSLVFSIPADAFQAAPVSTQPVASAVPPAAKKQPYVGALANVPHPVRRVS